MKFTSPDLDLAIVLEARKVTTLVLEDLLFFRKFTAEIYHQIQGQDGSYVFAENNKIIEAKKDVILISDFLGLDINSKQILTKLQGKLVNLANEELELFTEVNDKVQEFLSLLEENMPIELTHAENITPTDLVKIGDFAFRSNESDMVENVLSYLEIVSSMLRPKLFILINLRKYLTHTELEGVFRTVVNKDIPIFCIESGMVNEDSIVAEWERIYTLDADLCLI